MLQQVPLTILAPSLGSGFRRALWRDALTRGMGELTVDAIKTEFEHRVEAGEFIGVDQASGASSRAFTTREMIPKRFVRIRYFGVLAPRRGAFSVSSTGLIASRAGRVAQRRQLVWGDRAGRVLGTVGPADDLGQAHAELAPDGRRVAVARTVQGNLDIWLVDLGRGVASRFTSASSAEVNATWSPDGRGIVFQSNRNGAYDLFERSVTGAGEERPLLVTPVDKVPLSWSRDGRFLLYRTRSLDAQSGFDIWALPLDGNRTPFPVAQTGFDEDEGQFSPDGHWVAYGSNESGRHEIYVQPFPGPGEKVRVTTDGGSQVRWRPDGKELYYVAPDNRMMAVTATATDDGQTLHATAPVALFTTRLARGINIAGGKPQYAVAHDGRFLMNVRIEEQSPITIIQNWTALMQR